jgi:hypothetical protein
MLMFGWLRTALSDLGNAMNKEAKVLRQHQNLGGRAQKYDVTKSPTDM